MSESKRLKITDNPKVKMTVREYAGQGNAILGIRDSGKSYTAMKAAEELLKNNIPIVVFDPVGIWRHLKTGVDGFKGFQVVVAGGNHGDLPLNVENAPKLMRAAMKEGISIIFDLYSVELSVKRIWIRIVQECIDILMYENMSYGLRHVYLEEAAEFCLSPDTEILTEFGFRKYNEIFKGDKAICFDLKDQIYKSLPIQRVIIKDFEGDLLNFKNRQLDILVTPEHRNVIQRYQHDPARYKKYDFTFCEAQKCPKSFFIPGARNIGFKHPFMAHDYTDDILRIIGWIITDGSFHDSRTKKALSLTQAFNSKKLGKHIYKEMTLILDKYEVVHRDRIRKRKLSPDKKFLMKECRCREWYFNTKISKTLFNLLPNGIHRIPRQLLLNGNWHQLMRLYIGLMEGDGTSDSTGKKWRYFYAGLNEGLADDFQELCTLIGIRSIKRFVPLNKQWRVSISYQKDYSIRKYPTKSFYKGIVWDVTVPTGSFVARRNGQVFITGNCPQRIQPQHNQVYSSIERLARMGRNMKLGYTLINQRAEEINKAIFEISACCFLHKQVGKNSLLSIKKWFEVKQTGDSKQIIKTLPTLEQGECWMVGDDEPIRIKIIKKMTFHPSPSKQEDKTTSKPADVSAFIKQIAKALEPAEKPKGKAIVNQQPDNKIKEILDLKNQLAIKTNDVIQRDREINRLTGLLKRINYKLNELQIISGDTQTIYVTDVDKNRQSEKIPKKVLSESKENVSLPSNDGSALLGRGELAILKFLYFRNGREFKKEQIGAMTGYSPKSGGFNNSISKLFSAGLIKREGARLSAMQNYSQDILSLIGTPENMSLEVWLKKLGKCAREIYNQCLKNPHKGYPKDELASITGYSATSGGFNNAISQLITLGLITRTSDGIRLNPELIDL